MLFAFGYTIQPFGAAGDVWMAVGRRPAGREAWPDGGREPNGSRRW
jgi:hypothetical protein